MKVFRASKFVVLVFAVLPVFDSTCRAVTSKLSRHTMQADFIKGQRENTVIDSRGTIGLARACEEPTGELKEAWAVNTIVADANRVFIGTSANGCIFKYSEGKLKKIYPTEPNEKMTVSSAEPNDANSTADANIVKAEEYLKNQHVFAMRMDSEGKLLAGLSGTECKLLLFEEDKPRTLFEPGQAKYIFAIMLDAKGNIFLGTGPEGALYQLDRRGRNPRIIYSVRDKNIMSLALGSDGFIYAGTDQRGLVYKINPQTGAASVLYDTGQAEVAALLFDGEGNLYAAATSCRPGRGAGAVSQPTEGAGRPEPKPDKKTSDEESSKAELKLTVANVPKEPAESEKAAAAHPEKGAATEEMSHIYRIDSNGFVTDVFQRAVVLFGMAREKSNLIAATGNNAELFSLDLQTEQKTVVYEDKRASQITAVIVQGDNVLAGTANPAKLIRLKRDFAKEGVYFSELIDASQPASWGKLQLEADIPRGCKVLASSRSGNVGDVNDPTFSPWTEAVEVTHPVQLFCPLGRFCQYKLILQSGTGQNSPTIREVAVAYVIPNLAPRVKSVSVTRPEAKDKQGVFKIEYKAEDDNNDKLIYRIDFRKVPRERWIKLASELEADNHEWDGRTVEDGRYEIRVTASDERDNSPQTKLAGTRISEPVVVDNTAAVIKSHSISLTKRSATIRLRVVDELSAIGKVEYSLDSNEKWNGTLPDDSVYDTTSEDFTVRVENLSSGDHVVVFKISDAVGNTAYKMYDLTVGQD